MSHGPLAGLATLDDLLEDPKLDGYHLLPAARTDLLTRAGRTVEALASFDRAIELAPNDAERRQIVRRCDELR